MRFGSVRVVRTIGSSPTGSKPKPKFWDTADGWAAIASTRFTVAARDHLRRGLGSGLNKPGPAFAVGGASFTGGNPATGMRVVSLTHRMNRVVTFFDAPAARSRTACTELAEGCSGHGGGTRPP
jgi:hypothetical protein